MIEDTSRRDPLIHLLGARREGIDGYITGMEAAGQQQLVNGAEMPAEGPWEELEALGFVRGEPVDELFVQAIIPAGWRKESTDHAMHSRIVDERGIERVRMFYKAAFYDRRADCRVVQVGAKEVLGAIWSEGPVELPDYWHLMTDSEKAGVAATLADTLAMEIDKRKYMVDNPKGMQSVDTQIVRIEAILAEVLEKSELQ